MRLNVHLTSAGRKSRAGKFLRRLGPSWSASPARRLVQAGFFVLFVVLFFYVAWPSGAGDFAEARARKERIDIELFLALDPLVSISAAIARRAWVWSLWLGGAMIVLGIVLPRMFCGYLCPMGTLIDLFDWAIGKHVKRMRVSGGGWWRNLRFYILAAVLAAAGFGVILTGYVAAIPTVTRGFEFLAAPVQTGLLRGWGHVPGMSAAQIVSAGLFVGVLLLGLLRPRFWCRHLCPTGAIFSIGSYFRLTERKVQEHCIRCGKCAKHCSFDAINDDFSTSGEDCAFCQTCGGVCPVDAVHFAPRWSPAAAGAPSDSRAGRVSRRQFVAGAAAGAVGGTLAAKGLRWQGGRELPAVLRPPGVVSETDFLKACVRCDQCLRVCPSGMLQPMGIGQGWERLWTPRANADFGGCEPSCNNCGQVCPTGAIPALALAVKREARMGLAEVDGSTCLACRGRGDCETRDKEGLVCADACESAGYAAITIEGDPHPMPTVQSERCVGCGMCQSACYRTNVKEKNLLSAAAIRVRPGVDGRELARAGGGSTTMPSTQPGTKPADDVPYVVPD